MRLFVIVECVAILLYSFGQILAVDSSTGDAFLGIPVLNDDLEFCTHFLRHYCIIVLLRSYIIAIAQNNIIAMVHNDIIAIRYDCNYALVLY